MKIKTLITEGRNLVLTETLGAAPAGLLTEAHEGSVWVALVLPDHAKAFLKRYQVGSPNDDNVGLHITLAYLGKATQYTPELIKKMRKAVEVVAAKYPPLEFTITGSGRFAASPNSDNLVPVVLLPSAKGLAALRTDIVKAFEKLGVKMPGPFDFMPHICLGYVTDPEIPIPKITRGEDSWVTTHVSFFVNPDRADFKLSGTKKPENALHDRLEFIELLVNEGKELVELFGFKPKTPEWHDKYAEVKARQQAKSAGKADTARDSREQDDWVRKSEDPDDSGGEMSDFEAHHSDRAAALPRTALKHVEIARKMRGQEPLIKPKAQLPKK